MRLTVNLDKRARRPIAELDWFEGCLAMIDTGALFPIWVKDEKLLIKLGAALIRTEVPFSGFGGETKGNLYRVNFRLNDLHFIQMPIVAHKINTLNCHMILSATMFDRMAFAIDNRDKKLYIDTFDNQPVRILKVSDEYNRLSVYLAEAYETEQEYLRGRAGL